MEVENQTNFDEEFPASPKVMTQFIGGESESKLVEPSKTSDLLKGDVNICPNNISDYGEFQYGDSELKSVDSGFQDDTFDIQTMNDDVNRVSTSMDVIEIDINGLEIESNTRCEQSDSVGVFEDIDDDFQFDYHTDFSDELNGYLNIEGELQGSKEAIQNLVLDSAVEEYLERECETRSNCHLIKNCDVIGNCEGLYLELNKIENTEILSTSDCYKPHKDINSLHTKKDKFQYDKNSAIHHAHEYEIGNKVPTIENKCNDTDTLNNDLEQSRGDTFVTGGVLEVKQNGTDTCFVNIDCSINCILNSNGELVKDKPAIEISDNNQNGNIMPQDTLNVENNDCTLLGSGDIDDNNINIDTTALVIHGGIIKIEPQDPNMDVSFEGNRLEKDSQIKGKNNFSSEEFVVNDEKTYDEMKDPCYANKTEAQDTVLQSLKSADLQDIAHEQSIKNEDIQISKGYEINSFIFSNESSSQAWSQICNPDLNDTSVSNDIGSSCASKSPLNVVQEYNSYGCTDSTVLASHTQVSMSDDASVADGVSNCSLSSSHEQTCNNDNSININSEVYHNQSSNLKDPLAMQTTKSKKIYTCEQCGKGFVFASHLTRHSLAHSREKQHKCEHCGKCFKQSASLKRHLPIHSGEKEYICKYCKKSFNQSANLSRHLSVHIDEKEFKCVQCDRCFKRRDNLIRHISSHSNTSVKNLDASVEEVSRENTLQGIEVFFNSLQSL